MQAPATMLNMFIENLLLITYACAMGGLVWSLLLLKPWRHHVPVVSDLASQSIALMRWGAQAMARFCRPRTLKYCSQFPGM